MPTFNIKKSVAVVVAEDPKRCCEKCETDDCDSFTYEICSKCETHFCYEEGNLQGGKYLDNGDKICCECNVAEERMKEMEQYDRYILWTYGKDNEIKIHEVVYFGDDMLEDMYQRIMNGGIEGVYISSVEGGNNCSDKIKMWEKREEHIIYSWTTTDGANVEFKRRAEARQGGLW